MDRLLTLLRAIVCITLCGQERTASRGRLDRAIKGRDQNGRVTPARNQRGHICRPHGAQPLPEKAAEAIADESIEGRQWGLAPHRPRR